MKTKQAERLNALIEKYGDNIDTIMMLLDVIKETDGEHEETLEEVPEEIGVLMRGGSAIIYASGNDPYEVIEQIKRGFRYASDNGMEVVQVVTTMEELDETLQKVDIDVLLVRDHSRLSRDAIGRLQALMVLEQLGIELHVIGK